jgi:hypothetical protein
MKMEGSATEALERHLKRQRKVSSYKNTIVVKLDQVFSSLYVPEEGIFPSISWDFEEEPYHQSVTENPPPMGLLQTRDHEGVALGLARSKISFKRGLNSLISTTNSTVPVKSLPDKKAPIVFSKKISVHDKQFVTKPELLDPVLPCLHLLTV